MENKNKRNKLSTKDRRVAYWLYNKGFTMEKIARFLDVSQPTISNTIKQINNNTEYKLSESQISAINDKYLIPFEENFEYSKTTKEESCKNSDSLAIKLLRDLGLDDIAINYENIKDIND